MSWTCRNFLRYDFVSLLLSHLLPESNENSVCSFCFPCGCHLFYWCWWWLSWIIISLAGFKKSKSREVDIDTKSQFLTSLELHSQLKKLSHMPARNYMELDHGSHLNDGPSSCLLNRSPMKWWISKSATYSLLSLGLLSFTYLKHNEATNFQNYSYRSITDHRSSSTTTWWSPWNSELLFPQFKSNFPINQRLFS